MITTQEHDLHLTENDYAIAKSNGISRILAYRRYSNGWTAEDAVMKPKGNTGRYKRLQRQAKENGIEIKVNTIFVRLESGWTEEEAVTTPVGEKRNSEREWIELAASNGIGYQTYHGRRRRGWTREKAATDAVNSEFNWRVRI